MTSTSTPTIKLIVAGGRDFQDYSLLKARLDHLLSNAIARGDQIEIVSGRARGADSLGERYAKENGYPVKEFPADWDLHGRSAGFKRNAEMADYGTHLAAFWDGSSRGTKSMIDLAKKKGLVVRVTRYSQPWTHRKST